LKGGTAHKKKRNVRPIRKTIERRRNILRKKYHVLTAITIIATFLLAACGGAATPTQAPAAAPTEAQATQMQATQAPASSSKGLIVVGSKDFTEQFILGQITVQALRNAGYQVERRW
jgi:glycine betaine/choline ABC-type transport system substrate-binding protein